MPLIFVYGTLKRGDVRARFLTGERFVGEAVTLPRYRLVDCGAYPGLVEVPKSSPGVAIEGELYDVSPETLARLDAEEGVDEGLYARRPVRLDAPHADVEVQAYFYLRPIDVLPDGGSRWIPRG